MLHGEDLIVSMDIPGIGHRFLASSTSCEFDQNTNFIQICAPHGQGGWVHNKPTTNSWALSAECLVTDNKFTKVLIDAQRNKEKLLLHFHDAELNCQYKGEAYIASLREVGTVGDLAKLSLSFTAAGALEDDELCYRRNYPYFDGDILRTRYVVAGDVMITDGVYDAETDTLKFNRKKETIL